MRRRAALVAVAAVCVCLPLGAFATIYATTSVSDRPQTISRDQAVAAALKDLPDNGAGYEVVKTELEPNSTHFQFTGVDGSSLGEDGVQECVIIPPLPLRWGCRPYPVWVIEVRGKSCEATISINGFSGRFGGAGTDGCDIAPTDSPAPWFVASWE